MTDECECVWADDQWHECEYCYLRNEDKCTCKEDHIDLNCQECF